MKKIIACFVAALMLAGCQPQDNANRSKSMDNAAQQKEASRKLTVEAMALLSQQNFQNAIAALDAAIRLDPSNIEAQLILGQILLKAGQNDRAVDFLDNSAKNFPDNGMIFYMLGVANKMNNKKLPAALAARRSFEIFKNANDQDGAQKAAELLQSVINEPDQPNAK